MPSAATNHIVYLVLCCKTKKHCFFISKNRKNDVFQLENRLHVFANLMKKLNFRKKNVKQRFILWKRVKTLFLL